MGDQDPVWVGTRVLTQCPFCHSTLAIGPPSHSITIGIVSGVTASPWFSCPECNGIASITRGRTIKRSLRLPPRVTDKKIVPAVFSSPPDPDAPRLTLPATPENNVNPQDHHRHFHPPIDSPLLSHTLNELRAMCYRRGLKIRGSKADLAMRLSKFDEEQAALRESPPPYDPIR